MDRAHDRNQIRQLHLLRDERDRELLTAAQSRAGNAVLRVSQLLAAICLLRGEPVWTALLSLTFVNAAARCFHQFRCDRERAYLLLGLAAGAVALGLCSVFLIKGEAALTMGRLVAFGVLYYMLRALAGLLFVGVLLAMFWIAHRVGHLDGEQWEAYFQSVPTVGLLLRGGCILLLALGMVTALSWPLFSLLGFPTPGRLALIFFVAAGGHLVRAFSDQREELISKLLRLKS